MGRGVNDAVKGFGSTLLKFYGKAGRQWEADVDTSISKLGVYTDNGAYYYYNSGNYSSPEAALDAVHAYSRIEDIPFQYVLLDSWWYYKGVGGGVKNWTARNDAFPHGLKRFHQST